MPKKLSREAPIIVTVTDEKIKDIKEVADQLSEHGMNVDRIMPITGVITGSSSTAKFSTLEKVSGVMSVEEEINAELS